ncbi:MAG: sigma-70 family RNA polymerase sigma factor [Rivularia sp. (in: cyanobacteria)]
MLEKKRQNLVDKFSSFICFTANNSQIQLSWKHDARLEKNMKSKVEADPFAKESFWAQYFLKALLIQEQSNQNLRQFNQDYCCFTKKHFSAYLQEACFKAAKDIHHEFKYIKHKYSLEEFFQIANIAANSPNKFFQSFNFERHQINIEAYAITAFKRFIRNQIYRQDLEARRTRFSSYGLLKDLSAGELNDALLAQNFPAEKIASHRLAWQCFNELFHMTSKSLGSSRNPSDDDLTKIANYYNQRCSQFNINSVAATNSAILEMLSTCIKAAKNYRNTIYLYFEEDYFRISDPTPSTWDVLIQQEEFKNLEMILDNLFRNMPELCQTILQLWQGLNLTQTEIAALLQYKYSDLQKQYQVARQLKKYNRTILKEFALQWNKTNPEIYLNNEIDIERIKSALDKCLQLYCQKLIYSILDKTIKQFSYEEQTSIFVCINLPKRLLAQTDGDDLEELNESTGVKLKFLEAFKQYLETNMCLERDSLSVVDTKIVDVVDRWIQLKQG